jgi:hypothetical protein
MAHACGKTHLFEVGLDFSGVQLTRYFGEVFVDGPDVVSLSERKLVMPVQARS